MAVHDSFHTPDPVQLDSPSESTLDSVPGDALADLLGSGADRNDPASRDYGERYTYRKVIGQGGQGIVLSAWDSLLEREVAIKALKAPFEPAKESILSAEARVNGMLEHPNILPTYDLQQDETGSPFFVMKKIEGVSLEELLRDSHDTATKQAARRGGAAYSRVRLINVFLQVCHAIEYAHSRGVLHLDLKTENVKLGLFGEVYVLDWGFAAKIDEKQKYIGGTPIYIAPERMERKRPDQRSDVYSLGVMLYRILTRQHPRNVSKISFREYRKQFKLIPIIPLRERDPSLPADLEAIVMKSLADEPAGRYDTVRELADDLENFLAVLPVSAYGEGPLQRTWKFLRRHRFATAAFGVILATAMVAGVMAWSNHKQSIKIKQQEDAARITQQALDRERQALRLRARARVPLEKAIKLIEERRERIEKEKFASRKPAILQPAFELLTQASTIWPDFPDVYYVRAQAYDLVGWRGKALADFTKTYTLDKSFIMAHYYAGIIYADKLESPQHDRAREEFAAMKEVDPNNEFAELGQARIAEFLGRTQLDKRPEQYKKALAFCEKALALSKNVSDVWYIRGMIFGSRQQNNPYYNLQKARDAYDQFLETRNATPSAFANRGDIRRKLGDIKGAIADYRSALSINPRYTAALKNLAWTYYWDLGDPEKGLVEIGKAKEVNPRDIWVYLNEAAMNEFLKRYDQAEEDYREAHDLCRAFPKLRASRPIVYYNEGMLNFRRGRLAVAEEKMTAALDGATGEALAVRSHRRGVIRFVRGQYNAAIADFDISLKTRTKDRVYPALMRWLALRFSGQSPQRKDLHNWLDAKEERRWLNAVGMYFLGEVKAAEVLKQAVTEKAKCEVYFYLGALAMTNNDPDAAIGYFRAAEKTGVHLYMEYRAALVFLERLTASPPVTKTLTPPPPAPEPKRK